jgi:hypothetical protein
MLAVRASRTSVHFQDRPYHSGKRRKQERFSTPEKRMFPLPGVIEVHPSSNVLIRTFNESPITSQSALKHDLAPNKNVQSEMPNSSSKSITDGLELIDKSIANINLQVADLFFEEEDKFGHCDYCDKEILIDPFYVSDRGTYLCDECYSSTGGNE